MKFKLGRVAAMAAIVGFLGFGGVSLAYAQDNPSTTTTPNSSTTTPGTSRTTPPRDHPNGGNCPNMGGSSGSSTPSSSSTSTNAGQL